LKDVGFHCSPLNCQLIERIFTETEDFEFVEIGLGKVLASLIADIIEIQAEFSEMLPLGFGKVVHSSLRDDVHSYIHASILKYICEMALVDLEQRNSMVESSIFWQS
jgi:hypothetical protein